MVDEAIVLPSQATMIFHNLLSRGIIHLGQGLSLRFAIALIRILTSDTNLTSLVLRSKYFSASEVMSHALLRRIFRDDFNGPRNGPVKSKLSGVILDSIVLVTIMLSIRLVITIYFPF